jgi:hypothetical protein
MFQQLLARRTTTRYPGHTLGLLAAAILAVVFYSASAQAACRTSTGDVVGPVLPNPIFGSGQGKAGVEHEDSIVGLWHVCFLTDAGATVFDEGFDMWNEGGTETLNDILPPPLPPNSAGAICLGVFKQTGPRTFKQRHPYWTADGSGALVGTGVILEEVRVSEDGKSYSGTFENISYDLIGGVTGDVTGVLKAERIMSKRMIAVAD